jgi:hypothetical protein
MCNNKLYHGRVTRKTGRVQWRLIDPGFPKPREPIKYHYEFQPVVHDIENDRLIQLRGDKDRVDVYARTLNDGGNWRQFDTKGSAAIGREAVYIPRHRTVLWLGDKQLFALDCRNMRIAQIDIELPDGLYTHECAMVYDPAHDVCVALIPSRFSGPMKTFLYRFESGSASYR